MVEGKTEGKYDTSEEIKDTKEKMERLEKVFTSINKLQLGSFRVDKSEGLTLDEAKDFKERIQFALSREIQYLDKLCENGEEK